MRAFHAKGIQSHRRLGHKLHEEKGLLGYYTSIPGASVSSQGTTADNVLRGVELAQRGIPETRDPE